MKYLLDTVIEWEGQMVYYTIYRCHGHVFSAQMQDNPKQIAAATNFYFHWDGVWESEMITDRQLYWLSETVVKNISADRQGNTE